MIQSLNGTYLNSVKIVPEIERELRFGDKIGLGVSHNSRELDPTDPSYYVFQFKVSEAFSNRRPPPPLLDQVANPPYPVLLRQGIHLEELAFEDFRIPMLGERVRIERRQRLGILFHLRPRRRRRNFVEGRRRPNSQGLVVPDINRPIEFSTFSYNEDSFFDR